MRQSLFLQTETKNLLMDEVCFWFCLWSFKEFEWFLAIWFGLAEDSSSTLANHDLNHLRDMYLYLGPY
jgi:hypothetical protein